MYEKFHFERSALLYLPDVGQQRFARDDHSRETVSFEIFGSFRIVHAHLRARVQRHAQIRKYPDRADIGDDERVGTGFRTRLSESAQFFRFGIFISVFSVT